MGGNSETALEAGAHFIKQKIGIFVRKNLEKYLKKLK